MAERWDDIALTSTSLLPALAIDQVASLAVERTNELVLYSTTRNVTPVFNDGGVIRPPWYGFDNPEEHLLIMSTLTKLIENKNIASIVKIARTSIATKYGNCIEMCVVAAFFLRNNGFRGNIKLLFYGPVGQECSVMEVNGRQVLCHQHCFVLLETEKEPSYVVDPWNRRSYPMAQWMGNLKGYGHDVVLLREGRSTGVSQYGVLIDPVNITLDTPNEVFMHFSRAFPPLGP